MMALGLLRFQVAGRAVGLQYQLTPEGREALDGSERDPDLALHVETFEEAG